MRFKATRHFRGASIGVLTILATLMAFGIFQFATRPNGVAVYFGEHHIGVMRWDGARNIDREYITVHTTARLEGQLGSRIRLDGEILANPVRIGGNAQPISFDSLISGLLAAVDYYVYGAIISIDGAQIASLPSQAAAGDLLAQVARHWGGDDVVEYEFAEAVLITGQYIHRADLTSRGDAFAALTSRQTRQEARVAQPGDSFYSIARAAGMSLEQLFATNPSVDRDAHLTIGQMLLVTLNTPILSVMTTERIEREEPIPVPIEIVSVTTLATGQQSVIQTGREGLRRVTVEVVRTNGTISEERIIHTEIIHPAVAEVIQVGT